MRFLNWIVAASAWVTLVAAGTPLPGWAKLLTVAMTVAAILVASEKYDRLRNAGMI